MGWTSVGNGTNVKEALPLPEKNRERTGKRLANLWRRNKINKEAHADRGLEIKWEISVYKVQTIFQKKLSTGSKPFTNLLSILLSNHKLEIPIIL